MRALQAGTVSSAQPSLHAIRIKPLTSHKSRTVAGSQAAWPGECSTGEEQSPIDIVVAETTKSTHDKPLALTYAPVKDWYVVNNGHTAQFTLNSTDEVSTILACGSPH